MAINYFHIQTIIILVSLTIGYVVWTYNSKSSLNRILTLIIICVLLVDISLLLQLKENRERYLYPIVILGSLGISFFTPLFHTLSLYYPIKRGVRRKLQVAVYLVSLCLSVLIIVSFPQRYIVEKLTILTKLNDISLKNLPLGFVVLYFLLTSFSIFLLFLATKNFLSSFSSQIIPYEKNTVKMLIVVGTPLAYLLSIVDVVNYFFNIPFPWMGFFLGLFTLFIVVLIFRFHLVDLRRLLRGILFFPALIAILVFIYISVILRNQEKIARMIALPVSITLIIEVFVIYLAVSTLKRLLDIPFIKRRFPNVSAFRETNIEPLEYLSYSLTVENLYTRLKEVFRDYVKIHNVFLLILDKEKNVFLNADRHQSMSLRANRELIDVLLKINRGITLEELLIYMNEREQLEKLHAYGVNLVFPITRRSEVVALILLPKRSIFRRWSYDDICSLNYLRIIMPALIDRCKMYENEKEIEKHEYRMEQAIVVGQMASGLAHEIRNPLSIISTSVETILRDGITEDDREKMLRYIQEEANRIDILAEKLLSLSFYRKPDFQNTDMVSVFNKLKTFLAYKFKDKHIDFIIENNGPCVLYSDPNLLFQIFLNLSLNSIEAITDGGTISVDYTVGDGVVTVFFSDNGPGIQQKYRTKIFEPFFTMKKDGSGLGLTVSKNLVEHLYGHLELVSGKRGACFKVTFPMMKVKD
jgi:signal transduction histidine kinase